MQFKLTFILACLSMSPLLSALYFECGYSNFEYNIANNTKASFDECRTFNSITVTQRDQKLERVIDFPSYRRPGLIEDICKIKITQNTVWYLPKELDKFFPKLNYIEIVSSDMKEIKQSDLKVFPELLHLVLSYNDIRVLESGLFKYNPKLFRVIIDMNDIQYIHPDILDNLSNLYVFDLTLNKCINMIFVRKTFHNLKKIIDDYCQNARKKAKKLKRVKLTIQRGKYFWILVICGVISAVFLVFAAVVFVHDALKIRKMKNNKRQAFY